MDTFSVFKGDTRDAHRRGTTPSPAAAAATELRSCCCDTAAEHLEDGRDVQNDETIIRDADDNEYVYNHDETSTILGYVGDSFKGWGLSVVSACTRSS